MLAIDRAYVGVALILAVVGMLLGLYMGAAADNRLVTLRVAIVLPGFVTLAIYGMLYRLWPAMKKAQLAPVQFWAAMIGITAIFIGTYFYILYGSVPIVAAGSMVFIVGAALMAWLFLTSSRDS
jgi:amino acid transporter